MKKRTIFSITGMVAAALFAQPALSEAIWTTVADGSEVDFNIYNAKEDVYLNGGPGRGAGTQARGLTDGTYVFMVTDPSGKALLSLDAAGCRLVEVIDGVFQNVDPAIASCKHATGSTEANYITVQLMPYADTPNNGGEYKTWLTPVERYTCSLSDVDCNANTHGFIPRYSKTDNFKVGPRAPHEIDTRFYDANGNILDGLGIVWSDSLGASNDKYSYWAPELNVFHEAHVEAPEPGTHKILIIDQPACSVGEVYVDGIKTKQNGPQTVSVRVTQAFINKQQTTFVDVKCQ